MPPGDYNRESVYLNDKEEDALQALAREFNTSKNAVVKILIREAAGLPLPDEYLLKLRERAGMTLLK